MGLLLPARQRESNTWHLRLWSIFPKHQPLSYQRIRDQNEIRFLCFPNMFMLLAGKIQDSNFLNFNGFPSSCSNQSVEKWCSADGCKAGLGFLLGVPRMAIQIVSEFWIKVTLILWHTFTNKDQKRASGTNIKHHQSSIGWDVGIQLGSIWFIKDSLFMLSLCHIFLSFFSVLKDTSRFNDGMVYCVGSHQLPIGLSRQFWELLGLL